MRAPINLSLAKTFSQALSPSLALYWIPRSVRNFPGQKILTAGDARITAVVCVNSWLIEQKLRYEGGEKLYADRVRLRMHICGVAAATLCVLWIGLTSCSRKLR